MSDTLAGLLGRAVESFERCEEEEAVQRLLEAWRESKDRRLALLLDRLSVRLPAGLVPLVAPRDLPRMLEHLVRNADDRFKELGERALDDFRKWPADPRLTPGLLVLAYMPLARSEYLFRPLRELLLHVGDPRALEPLRALHASLPSELGHAQRLAVVLRLLDAQRVLPLDAESSARCDALEEALARREDAEVRSIPVRKALLARIAASPEDDGARRVLADHLLEAGDPLGELITLQCLPRPDEPRIARLLELHGARWEAGLGPGVVRGGTRFERGFPVAVRMQVEPGQRLPPPGLFWSTVREIDWSRTGGEEVADWLAHPHLRGVTVLRGVNHTIALGLGRHPLPVRSLELSGEPMLMPGVGEALSSLPHLVRVQVHEARWNDVGEFAKAPLARRLERFEASEPRGWSLVATPAAEVPVELTLEHEAYAMLVTPILYTAKGFGTRALRLRIRGSLDAGDMRRLEEAAAAYARVEWDLPPASG